MNLVSAVLLFLAFSRPAMAEWNPSLASFGNLFRQVDTLTAPVGQAYFNPRLFNQDELGTRLAVLQDGIESGEEAAPCDCDQALPKRKSWVATLKISGNLFPPPPVQAFESAPGRSAFYNEFWLSFAKSQISPEEVASSTSSQVADRIVSLFSPGLEEYGGGGGGNEVALLRKSVFDGLIAGRVLGATTDAEWKSALQEAGAAWSSDEKVAFISYLGNRLSANYDYVRGGYLRAAPGDSQESHSRGAFDVVSLMKGLQSSTRTGVCRDIASAQAEMLQQLGFKNAYVVVENSLGGPHATVIAQDPAHPRQLVKFNYDMVGKSPDTLEVNALRQVKDKSTAYQIYRAGGGMVSTLPSELGMLLHEASGGDIREVDVFARSRTPFTGSLRLDRGNAMVNVFTGRLSDGSNVVGVAGQLRTSGDPQEDKYALKVGGGYARQTGGIDEVDAQHVYVNFEQYINSPWFRINRAVRARFETSTQISADSSVTGWVLENAGIKVEGKAGKTAFSAQAVTQYAGGLQDVRDAYKYGVSHNISYLSATLRRPISESWKAVADLAVGVREFGPQILASGGLQSETSSIKAGYEGRTEGSAPAVAYGMSRKFFTEAQKDLKGWNLSVEYLQPLEGDSGAGRTLKAGFTKSLKKR